MLKYLVGLIYLGLFSKLELKLWYKILGYKAHTPARNSIIIVVFPLFNINIHDQTFNDFHKGLN